ncbi:hypothetical protein ACFWZA_01895 [[Kitasatospora] papulosa]|uniref:hypothetical protein n=1 Tax=[Kitasatospora] papulosa TaxID=1464011 RepID=UPI0036ABBEE8
MDVRARQHSDTDSLEAAWHRELAAAPERAAELARELDDRMSAQPWHHPESPIPVRPLLLRRQEAEEIGRAAAGVIRLVVQECSRRASSPSALCDLLGIPVSPLLTDRHSWNQWALSQARPDIVLSGGVPKILECNISGAIGGPEQTARLDSVHWTAPTTRALARRGGMWSGHALEARRELLVHMAHSRGVDRPQLAVAGWNEENFAETVVDASRHGAPCVFVSLEELTEDGGLRTAEGRRIDVLLQKFITAGAYADGCPMEALEAAVAHDSTLIASPELGSVYSNKRILAWLTDRAHTLPSEQRDIVERYVPWTAQLADQPVLRQGARYDLLPLLEREQHSFVLKPEEGFGGNGVLVGRETSSVQWRAALNDLSGGGYIAQEYCPTDTHPVSVYDAASGEVDRIHAEHVIGPLLMQSRTTGFHTRFRRPGGKLVTTMLQGCVNTVFIHE